VTPCAYYIRLLVYHFIFQKNKNKAISTSPYGDEDMAF